MNSHRPIRFNWLLILGLILIIIFVLKITIMEKHQMRTIQQSQILATITLPKPIYHSDVSIEQTLLARRSVRIYQNSPLTLQQVSQLLWAAQGITSPHGGRTAPSAGALYPLEIYLICGNVTGLSAGIYHYVPATQSIEFIAKGDKRKDLASAAFNQTWVKNAAIDIVIVGVFNRTESKYGARGDRYVYMEAGHAAENIFLQAVPLKLGTVTVGAFDDASINKILNVSNDYHPIYIMPVGKIS